MTPLTFLRLNLVLVVVSIFALASLGYEKHQKVPPRGKRALVIECAMMAEECQWENGRMDIISGLKCVKDKIDKRLEQLREGHAK
jgi:hypothetical protein